jgi:hypothetical protein
MILDYLKGQLWWILQITGSIGVMIALTFGMIHGFCWKSYGFYMFMAGTTAGWMFLKSYETAPSFFHAWFMGTAALALLGFFTSKYYFNETLILPNYIGAVITILGSGLLIIR